MDKIPDSKLPPQVTDICGQCFHYAHSPSSCLVCGCPRPQWAARQSNTDEAEELRAECADCGHARVLHGHQAKRCYKRECECERFRLADAPLHDDYLAGMPQRDPRAKEQRELARDLAKQAADWGRWAADESRPHTFDERCALSQSLALASIALSLAWRDQP